MSLNMERAALRGELSDCEQELARIEMLADADVAQIRLKLNPNADSVAELDTEEALALMQELAQRKERAVVLQKKIRQLQGQLYG